VVPDPLPAAAAAWQLAARLHTSCASSSAPEQHGKVRDESIRIPNKVFQVYINSIFNKCHMKE
jgi:hypothetical protein